MKLESDGLQFGGFSSQPPLPRWLHDLKIYFLSFNPYPIVFLPTSLSEQKKIVYKILTTLVLSESYVFPWRAKKFEIFIKHFMTVYVYYEQNAFLTGMQ